ncbi:MAG: cytochrome c [Leptothrix ochracea]
MRTTHRQLASRTISLRPILPAVLVASALSLMAGGVAAQSAANGQTLYAQCQGCHGTPGANGLAKINNGVDANRTKIASNGGVAAMANFKSLTDANFNDLAAYIASMQVVNTTPILVNTAATAATGDNAGGGGCTLGGADRPMDPLWVLMLGGAAFVLRRRLPGAKVAR